MTDMTQDKEPNPDHQPRHPIYIVSKGRYKIRLTANALESMKVKYYIVVEAHECDLYKAAVNPKYGTVLILPEQYLKDYQTMDDIPYGEKSVGPGAARNFCWDHAISLGAKRHWVMDDNLEAFYRYYKGRRIRVGGGAILRAAEDFVDRFSNVPVAGLQYKSFCIPSPRIPVYVKNTRIYSCLLIENSCKHRWRGRYNEDTDLSLQVLKDGDCTIQFNAFLQGKIGTQILAGGNTDAFYAKEGTLAKSQMLVDMHPDVAELIKRFGRWHHYVNYLPFKQNQLKYVEGFVMPKEPNEYGMVLRKVKKRSGGATLHADYDPEFVDETQDDDED